MKDPDYQLRRAYFTALDGNVTSVGKVVPVYDRVPNNAVDPWIKFDTMAGDRIEEKDGFTTNRLFSIVCHTAFNKRGGRKQADQISSQVMQLIVDQTLTDVSGQFVFHEQTVQDFASNEDDRGDKVILQKIIIFNNFIQQI